MQVSSKEAEQALYDHIQWNGFEKWTIDKRVGDQVIKNINAQDIETRKSAQTKESLSICIKRLKYGGQYIKHVKVLFIEERDAKGHSSLILSEHQIGRFRAFCISQKSCKLMSTYCTSLSRVSLHCGITPQALKELCKVSSIKSLKLFDCRFLNNKSLSHLSQLSLLKTLILKDSDSIQSGLNKLKNIKNLSKLTLVYFKKLDNNLLEDMIPCLMDQAKKIIVQKDNKISLDPCFIASLQQLKRDDPVLTLMIEKPLNSDEISKKVTKLYKKERNEGKALSEEKILKIYKKKYLTIRI